LLLIITSVYVALSSSVCYYYLENRSRFHLKGEAQHCMDARRRQAWKIKHHEKNIMSTGDEDEADKDKGETEPDAAQPVEGNLLLGESEEFSPEARAQFWMSVAA
jgi:hypothetical protein